jgi:hypothetical protein
VAKTNPNQDVIDTLAAIRSSGNAAASAEADAIVITDAIAALRIRAQVGDAGAKALLDEARQLGINA